LPFNNGDLNRFKVDCTKDIIMTVRPEIRIEIHRFRIDGTADCQVLRGAVFCCTDNLKSQQLICAHCKKNAIRYQRIGYDGTVLNVSKAFPLSFRDDVPDGYQITPSWVAPAVLAAALGVSSISYKELCIMDDISKLHILGSSAIPEGLQELFIEKGRDEITDNITENIPDGWGYCEDCNQCENCDRISEEDYEHDKELAREDGHDKGYEEGKEDGHDEGYEEGKEDGYDEGYEEGKEYGHDEGYEEGKEDGYKEGYAKAKAEYDIKYQEVNKDE
jgi:hypothetical protein